jgi:hypothetical protein
MHAARHLEDRQTHAQFLVIYANPDLLHRAAADLTARTGLSKLARKFQRSVAHLRDSTSHHRTPNQHRCGHPAVPHTGVCPALSCLGGGRNIPHRGPVCASTPITPRSEPLEGILQQSPRW